MHSNKEKDKRIEQMELASIQARLNQIKSQRGGKSIGSLTVVQVGEKVKSIVNKKNKNSFDEYKDFPNPYRTYLSRCKEKGIQMEFSLDEFNEFIKQDCFYCGKENAHGIDKINPKGHYSKCNSVPCCWPCNRMKYTASQNDFYLHVKRIYDHLNLSEM